MHERDFKSQNNKSSLLNLLIFPHFELFVTNAYPTLQQKEDWSQPGFRTAARKINSAKNIEKMCIKLEKNQGKERLFN